LKKGLALGKIIKEITNKDTALEELMKVNERFNKFEARVLNEL